jgi:NAD+ synthase (glutamine-hydrolysing)
MRIVVSQINSIIGDLEYNKSKILEAYKKGVNDGVDLVVCPELALVGYPPLDLVEKKEFRDAAAQKVLEIAGSTNKTGLIFGSITEDNEAVGTNIHNSAIFCFEEKVRFIQQKTLIPNYDVFDEMRYFEPARNVENFDFKGEKLGISICEDIWNDSDYWYKRRYTKDPVNALIKKGATLLINISASPYSYGKRIGRKNMLSVLTSQNKLPLVYACFAGAQTELIFDGASMCLDSKGELVKLGKSFNEDYFIYDSKKDYEPIKEKDIEGGLAEEVLNALIFGLKEYCWKMGFKKLLVGLSGGIDSALTTYIAVQALEKENVHVLLMPSKYSSKGSIDDSIKLTENLGICRDNVSIQKPIDEIANQLKPIFRENIKGITEENLQARMRGIYLMAFSNQNNYLLLATGNKSELATGYCTLYGDMAGGLAVLGDVYKSDIYKIVEFINKSGEIIPQEIVAKAPSAELKLGQKDQDTLPEYFLLDSILKMYLEENKEFNEISEAIGNKPVVKEVLSMVDKNEFKRKQAAPVLRVSRKAFGYGRRYPIVQGWRSE